MRRIFISYSRKDIAFVRRLAADLENGGYEVWWDISSLRGGDDWVRLIPDAINASQYFLVVLSPKSIVSEWVRKEYILALHRHKRVIPLMLVSTTIPFSLNTLNYIDFTSGVDYTAGFNSLLHALGYTGDMPVIPLASLPHVSGNYPIPITLGVFLLLALVVFFTLKLPLSSLPSPAGVPSQTNSLLPETTAALTSSSPPVHSVSPTLPPLITGTALSTPTLTPSPTRTPAFQRLTFCVNSRSVNSINVRSGPGTTYARIGEPLQVGTCLDFRGQNVETTWLLIAPNQADPALRQYEGGWIFRELLGLGAEGPIDLPAVTLTPTPTSTPTPSRTPTP